MDDRQTIEDQCVIAQCASEDKTRLALEVLEKAGFTQEDVSVVRSREQLKHSGAFPEGQNMSPDVPPEDSAVTTSTMVGGALGATVGAVSLVGPMLIVGPLAGVALGAAAGGLLNLVGNRGVDQSTADSYEQAIAEGNVLIVITADATRLNQAERVLRTVNPRSLDRYSVEHQG